MQVVERYVLVAFLKNLYDPTLGVAGLLEFNNLN